LPCKTEQRSLEVTVEIQFKGFPCPEIAILVPAQFPSIFKHFFSKKTIILVFFCGVNVFEDEKLMAF